MTESAAGRAARLQENLEKRARRARRKLTRQARGAKRTILDTVRLFPQYGMLLWGLLTDRRVDVVDKLLVGAALAYIVMPLDMIPDYIPFFGEVDDVYVLVLAVRRMLKNAGTRVVRDHWTGSLKDLSAGNLRAVLAAAVFFLPRRSRRRLRAVLRR
jgi:uncharacterized membrane protein YkvA (DUF1232 family)